MAGSQTPVAAVARAGPPLRDRWGGVFVSTLTAGALVALIEVIVAASFATLIFSGSLSSHVPAGVGLALSGAVALLALTAVFSSQAGIVASIQDSPAAILALVAAGVATALPAGDPRAFPTAVVAIGVATATMGGSFLLLGVFRLGKLVRFVPYPVVGGFLAGSGWLLLRGGFEILTEAPLSVAALPQLLAADAGLRLLAGVGVAAALLVVMRRWRSPLALPATVVAASAVFFAVVAASGTSVAEAGRTGWLLGPFPDGGLWRPWALSGLAEADWGTVAAQLPQVATLVPVGVVALLLYASGIELAVDRDLDLDRELRAAGVANLAAGLGGAPGGYHALSLTALAHRAGADNRGVGVVAAALCAAVLFVGGGLLEWFPRPVVGGLIVFLGVGFLDDWLVSARSRLSRADYAVVVLIVAVVAAVGFLPGVAVGLAAALVLFVVNYSRVDPVKHALSGATYHSNVDRPPPQRAALRAEGEAIFILELQGFVFFGTASQVLDRVRDRIGDHDLPPPRFVVVDFRRVPAVDASAAVAFAKIHRLARSGGAEVVLTGCAPPVATQLRRGGVAPSDDEGLVAFPDLDRGVQWCEDRLLDGRRGGGADSAGTLPEFLAGDGTDPAALSRHLERLDLAPGEYLIRQGDAATDLYFLESGRLTVTLKSGGEDLRLRTMSPGVVVGEMALYLGAPRTASVVADTPVVAHRLTKAALEDLERDDPVLAASLHRYLARLLADRLADTLRTVQALRD